jgi:hypothetical protein
VTGRPIGLVSTGKGKFPEKTSSKPCKWVMWIRDVLTMGAVRARECKVLPVGAFVEGELHLVLDAIFSKPNSCLLFFILYFFFFKKLIRGHCPGVVISGGSVTHKYFHRNEKAGS